MHAVLTSALLCYQMSAAQRRWHIDGKDITREAIAAKRIVQFDGGHGGKERREAAAAAEAEAKAAEAKTAAKAEKEKQKATAKAARAKRRAEGMIPASKFESTLGRHPARRAWPRSAPRAIARSNCCAALSQAGHRIAFEYAAFRPRPALMYGAVKPRVVYGVLREAPAPAPKVELHPWNVNTPAVSQWEVNAQPWLPPKPPRRQPAAAPSPRTSRELVVPAVPRQLDGMPKRKRGHRALAGTAGAGFLSPRDVRAAARAELLTPKGSVACRGLQSRGFHVDPTGLHNMRE
jgi:hypothetical protein